MKQIESSDIEQLFQKHKVTLFKEIKQQYIAVPPQWIIYPNYHPYSMGGGEDYQGIWQEWLYQQRSTVEQKIDYFQAFKLPHAWLKTTFYYLYEDELADGYYGMSKEELKPYFSKVEALGFGNFSDCEKDIESDRSN